jgi:hypothetical protein
MTPTVDLPVPGEIDDLIARQWDRLRRPGTWFDGRERVAIAEAARHGDGDGPAATAARRIHDEPATITRAWLQALEDDGLTLAEYVEVLGLVSQLRAIDTFEFAVGRPTRPLPDPIDGDPSHDSVDDAVINGAWVPTVGLAFPPTILSSVPAENEAMHDVHEVLYLAPRAGDGYTMGNMAVVRDGLARTQMEFVAARTSLVNDCFF